MIDSLQTITHPHIIDTLKTIEHHVIIDTIKAQSNLGIDLVEKVDTFYNNAWEKLAYSLGAIGIIVPSLIAWFQTKELKLSEKRLKEEIEEKTQVTLATLRSEINEEYKKSLIESRKETKEEFDLAIEELKQEYDNSITNISQEARENLSVLEKYLSIKINALGSRTQGFAAEETGDLEHAIYYYSRALRDYIQIKSKINANITCGLIINLLERTDKTKLDQVFKLVDTSFKECIEKLKETDKKNVFTERIAQIETVFNSLPA